MSTNNNNVSTEQTVTLEQLEQLNEVVDQDFTSIDIELLISSATSVLMQPTTQMHLFISDVLPNSHLQCSTCSQEFTCRRSLSVHQKRYHHIISTPECLQCHAKFSRFDALDRHAANAIKNRDGKCKKVRTSTVSNYTHDHVQFEIENQ